VRHRPVHELIEFLAEVEGHVLVGERPDLVLLQSMRLERVSRLIGQESGALYLRGLGLRMSWLRRIAELLLGARAWLLVNMVVYPS
jgi:hypothetical protein